MPSFPQVQATSTGTFNATSGVPEDITLPASIAEGELLIVLVAAYAAPSYYGATAGWTSFSNGTYTSHLSLRGYWKYAAGGGADALAVQYNADADGSYICFRISGGFQPIAQITYGGGGNPDSYNVTHTDGAYDNLFISVVAAKDDEIADAAPTNYSNLLTVQGASTEASISTARRELNSASDDPGAFDWTTYTPIDYFVTSTIVISPKTRFQLGTTFDGPQLETLPADWNIGHIYTLHPNKFDLPRITLKKANLYSGRLTPDVISWDPITIDQTTIGQIHNLSLDDFNGPAAQIGSPSVIDNTSIASEQFLFAWVEASETSFGAAHWRNDENVFAFELSHSEGDFATLTIDVINPRVGLLSAGRKRWAWFSWDTGSGIEALFFGRLVGIPQEMEGEIIRLNFIARPQGYDDTKAALAATMRTAPYYDPMWYNEDARLDSDTVLEGRPELWHIDRVTHEVTSSNVLVGEDGTVDFGTNHFYDDMTVGYSQTPGRIAQVQATVAWRQLAQGYVNITDQFPSRIETFTYTGLLDDWPDPDTEIGGGWTVWDVSGVRLDDDRKASLNVQLRTSANWESITLGRVDPESTAYWIEGGEQMLWWRAKIKPFMVLKYEVDREYAEVATFDLYSDVQPVLTEPGDDEIIQITMSANADDPIDGSPPIGELSSYTFFHQARGRQALEHVACVARAQLMARARAIDVSCAIPFALGTQLSCRKNASVDDDRLPGGTASGKVTSYVLSLNGDTGEAICVVNIGCTIGNGGSLSEAEGTPRYVDAGYVDLGYQSYSDAATYLADGDITIGDYSDVAINDDGIRFDSITSSDAVVSLQILDDADDQLAYVNANGGRRVTVFDPWTGALTKEQLADLFNDVYTEVFLDVVDLEGAAPFETQFPITVSLLKLPKTIDLESS